MKINQAAELAGITSKNIRFYEDQGLIAPARDASNGYRDYSMENVEQLCRIRCVEPEHHSQYQYEEQYYGCS